MRMRWLGWVLLLVLALNAVGLAQETVEETDAAAAWEFFLGTWEHASDFGLTHRFQITQSQPSSDVRVDWQRLDPLLGTAIVGSSTVLTFFDSDGNPTNFTPLELEETEDVCAMAVWTSPINAYGFFYKRQRGAGASEDEILLVGYRVGSPNQPGVNSSRENYVLTMLLTRVTAEE